MVPAFWQPRAERCAALSQVPCQIDKSLCNILPEVLEQKVNNERSRAQAAREAENICATEAKCTEDWKNDPNPTE